MSFLSNKSNIIPQRIIKDNNRSIQHILKNNIYLKLPENNINIDNPNMFRNKILFNQFGTIDSYGLLYFYNENGIYFFDNKSVKNILTEKKIESNFLFYLKSFQKIFKICLLDFNLNNNTGNQNKNNIIIFLVIIIKGENGNYILYINIDTLFKEVNQQETINLKEIFNIKEEENIIQNNEEKGKNNDDNNKNEENNKNNFIISNDIIFTIYSKNDNDSNDKNNEIKNNNIDNNNK